MNRHIFVLGFVAALWMASPVSAQHVNLQIKDGLVNLDANGASVRQILDEWARVGGTRVVNGDRVVGGPVTLKLENTPEHQALEIILRTVAGYMAAPRAANAQPGASIYDRILVLPTSVAPPVPAAANNTRTPAAGRFVAPRPADDDSGQVPQPSEGNEGVFMFPQPGQFPGAPAFGQPAVAQPQVQQPQPGNPFAPTPVQPQQAVPFGQPASMPFVPVQPVPTPFGTPAQPGATPPAQPGVTPFGTPVQPGAAPFGTPMQPSAVPNPNAEPPAAFTFTPVPQPETTQTAPTGFTIGSPTPGVAQPQTQRPPKN